MDRSWEDGEHEGLGLITGDVVRFENDPDRPDLKVPQIGWNRVNVTAPSPHFAGIPDGTWFYFVHSYYVAPTDDAVVAGKTDYICRFAAAVWKDNVFACQFHPEKSQKWGLKLLENFVGL
jgi:glutamine amidotransferase